MTGIGNPGGTRWGRPVLREVDNIDQAMAVLSSATFAPLGGGAIVDLDNCVTTYERVRDLDLIASAVDGLAIERVLVVSNARWPWELADRCRHPVISRARKPFTPLRRLRDLLGGEDIVAVVGDQVLTDGLLAVRLGVDFIHITTVPAHEPLWPKAMRWAGWPVKALLWRVVDER